MKKAIFIIGVIMGVISVAALILGLVRLGVFENMFSFKKEPIPADEGYSE